MMTTHDEKSFLRTLLTPAVNDGGQGLRSLFSDISGQAPSGVDEHQGAANWNAVIDAVLGPQPADGADPADTAPSAQRPRT